MSGQPNQLNSQNKAAIALRNQGILERKAAGVPREEIAAEFGLQPNSINRIVAKAIREAGAASAQELRDREYEHLMLLRETALEVMEKRHYLVHNGVLTNVEDDMPTLRAIGELRQLSERVARLLGLDMPVKIDTTVSVRFEVAVPPEVYQ